MKIYLAARYERRMEMLEVARAIDLLGHQVTARWIQGKGLDDADNARYGLTDLTVADTLVLYTEDSEVNVCFSARGGRHVEFGFALKAGKSLVIVGPKENIFHELHEVRDLPDTAALLLYLGQAQHRSSS